MHAEIKKHKKSMQHKKIVGMRIGVNKKMACKMIFS